jgi:hypothetical protein
MKSAAKAFDGAILNLGTKSSEERASSRAFEHTLFRYGLASASVAGATALGFLAERFDLPE